ncbi:MAG: dethiobiotin synthase [Lentisphaerae bacterium GWF2_50_93]|nr:MAG: dethiobiotin synthase [Lentisphaerae bacterium GWF2_50_93]
MGQIPVKSYFITGTGTDVGKTIATAGIAGLFISLGRKVSIMKPCQTGIQYSEPDIAMAHSLFPGIFELPAGTACPYAFPYPASPALAASHQKKTIDMRKIIKAYEAAISTEGLELLLVEGAGGLMVPITENHMMIDIPKLFDIPAILVADAGLGTVNHTLLSIEAMKKRKIKIAGVILNRMPSPAGALEKDNIRTIEKYSGVPVLASISRISPELNLSKPANFADCLLARMRKQKKLLKLM